MRKILLSALSFFLFFQVVTAQNNPGAITFEQLEKMRTEISKNQSIKPLINATTNNDIKKLSQNRSNVGMQDHYFSNKVKTKGITNQESSVRCWLFTGLNVLRPKVIEKYNLSSFQFSPNYCFFYDQLEKANLFFEGIIATTDKDVRDRRVEWLFDNALGDGGQTILDEYILKEGEELGTFYGFEYLGVWKENETELAAEYGKVPGNSRYTDLNNDKKINEDDKVILGSGQPDFTFGITNTFDYKNFDLSVNIFGVQGNQVLNARRYWLNRELRVPENLRYYRKNNQDTDVPGFSNKETDPTLANSRWIEDGSFIRLRNISLGYTLNSNILNKIGLSSARLYLSGQNLLTITNYSGFDPELSSNGNSDIKVGFDQSPYPSAKIYTVGLNVKF